MTIYGDYYLEKYEAVIEHLTQKKDVRSVFVDFPINAW